MLQNKKFKIKILKLFLHTNIIKIIFFPWYIKKALSFKIIQFCNISATYKEKKGEKINEQRTK